MKRKEIEFDAEALVASVERFANFIRGGKKSDKQMRVVTLTTLKPSRPNKDAFSRDGMAGQR